MRNDNENKISFICDSENRMTTASWAFKKCVQDYKTFEVVPGISSDCKTVSNRHGFPLFTINGRANDSAVLTFFSEEKTNQTL